MQQRQSMIPFRRRSIETDQRLSGVDAIDLFAGFGGWTCAAKMAGFRVRWAANHSKDAVHWHAVNNPEVQHACQDLHQADFRDAPAHDVLLASPSCTGHTHARGEDRPGHDAARATAWAVVTCAEVHRPPVAVVENVVEFLDWVLYPAWRTAMEALGYAVSPHVLDAADHGVPQNRERVFLVCTRSMAPLVLALPEREHVAAETIVEWDAYPWRPVQRAGRSPWTLRQIQHGRDLGLNRFLLPYYKSARQGKNPGIRTLDRPIGTLTTLDRWGLVDGDRMRMVQPTEARTAMSFPDWYQMPTDRRTALHLLGNAICPVVGADILTAIKATA